MNKFIKPILGIAMLLFFFTSCEKKEYKMGDLNAPTNLQINTNILGVDATNPNGDGSGLVEISISADNAIAYKINFDAASSTNLTYLPTGSITYKYTRGGINKYIISAVAYGKGGSSSTITKEITVRSDFDIVGILTGGSSRTWVMDEELAGHFGVGPWDGSLTPEWWAAKSFEKSGDACFGNASFTFNKDASNNLTLNTNTPDGAFTKGGALTTLPGIPATTAEACYPYAGGSSGFNITPATSGIPASVSIKQSIVLEGNDTFIGYGAVQKEYEILQLSEEKMYLRVRGTETGNAWYLKLKAQ